MFHVDLPQVSQPHAVSEFEDIDLAIRLLGAHEASAVLPGLYPHQWPARRMSRVPAVAPGCCAKGVRLLLASREEVVRGA